MASMCYHRSWVLPILLILISTTLTSHAANTVVDHALPSNVSQGQPNGSTVPSSSFGSVRECPKVPIATCADLETYGIHHAEECECKEFHGEGEYTCRTKLALGQHTASHAGIGSTGDIWCEGKLSRSESFLASPSHQGNLHVTPVDGLGAGQSVKTAEERMREQQAVEAKAVKLAQEQKQKQTRTITLLGCSGLLLVALVTALLGRGRSSGRPRRTQKGSLDMPPNNFAERDAEAAAAEGYSENRSEQRKTQVEMGTFA